AIRQDMNLYRAYTSAQSGWYARMGPAFVKGVLAKFNVSQGVPKLEGTVDERAKQLMNGRAESRSHSSGAPKFIDAPPDAPLDANGNRQYVIEGDTSGELYTESEKISAERIPGDIVNPDNKLLSRLTPSTLSKVTTSLNWLGAGDATCTLINMIGIASVASKVSNAA